MFQCCYGINYQNVSAKNTGSFCVLFQTETAPTASVLGFGQSLNRLRHYSTQEAFNPTAASDEESDAAMEEPFIKDDEKIIGSTDKLEFQAETAELLHIVAKSLYSENEVTSFECVFLLMIETLQS